MIFAFLHLAHLNIIPSCSIHVGTNGKCHLFLCQSSIPLCMCVCVCVCVCVGKTFISVNLLMVPHCFFCF